MTTTARGTAIETTLGALALADQHLHELASMRMPVRTAYLLAKLVRLAAVEIKDFYAQRDRMIREMGDPTPDGGAAVPPARMAEFQARMTELAEIPISIASAPLRLSDLGEITVAAGTLVGLGPLVDLDT